MIVSSNQKGPIPLLQATAQVYWNSLFTQLYFLTVLDYYTSGTDDSIVKCYAHRPEEHCFLHMLTALDC